MESSGVRSLPETEAGIQPKTEVDDDCDVLCGMPASSTRSEVEMGIAGEVKCDVEEKTRICEETWNFEQTSDCSNPVGSRNSEAGGEKIVVLSVMITEMMCCWKHHYGLIFFTVYLFGFIDILQPVLQSSDGVHVSESGNLR